MSKDKDADARNHPIFQKNLIASVKAVELLAQQLRNTGHIVEMPKLNIAGVREDAWKYRDDGDLFVDNRHRIEVKTTSYPFTCLNDWPWKDEGRYIVCDRASHNRAAKRLPFAYVLVAPDMKHLAVAYVRDSRSWYVDDVRNGQYEGEDGHGLKYLCPLDKITWLKLEEFGYPPEEVARRRGLTNAAQQDIFNQ